MYCFYRSHLRRMHDRACCTCDEHRSTSRTLFEMSVVRKLIILFSLENVFMTFWITAVDMVDGTGIISLSEALKSNTTLTLLDLTRKEAKRQSNVYPSRICFPPFFFVTTDISIGKTGAESLFEALKSNTTLTELHLGCEDKRKRTYKRHPSTIHSFPFIFI